MSNEKRLIDANEALRMIKDSQEDNPFLKIRGQGEIWRGAHDNAIDSVNTCPAVDAVEVVHGRWLDIQETEMYVPDMKFTITKTAETCSECKARIGFVGPKRYLFDAICPNCGAKMDGETT